MEYIYDGQDQQIIFQENHQGVFELSEGNIIDVLSDIINPNLIPSCRTKLMEVLSDVDNPDVLLIHSNHSYELFILSTLATESGEDSYSAEVPELIYTTDENFDSSKFIKMDVNEDNIELAKSRLQESNIFNKDDIYIISQNCMEEGSELSYIIAYIPDKCFTL